MPRSARLSVAASACAAAVLAGCGGGGASADDGPASLVPRDAALYVEATIRPEGAVRDDALAAAGKVLRGSDPERRIEELVAEAFGSADEPKLDYARDVKPWLGERAGFWLAASGSGEGSRGAAVIATEDRGLAQAAIDRAVRGSAERFTSRSHRDVDYQVNGEGGAAAVVEDFAVFGTEAELKRTIDAAEGEPLAGDER